MGAEGMNILITGGAGFIGSKLAQKLAQDKSNVIYLVDNFFYGHWHLTYPWIENYTNIVLLNRDLVQESIAGYLQDIQVMYLLHALVGQPRCDLQPDLAFETNFHSCVKLAMMSNPSTTVIFPNTNSAYGTVTDGVCDENTPVNPISLYSQTKQNAETAILSSHERSVVLRLATVFGVSPRMRLDLLVNTLTWNAHFDEKIDLFQPNAQRNYIHIDDVVDAFILAAENVDTLKGGFYNVGNDSLNMSKGDLVRKIAEIVPCKVEEIEKEDPDKRSYLVSSRRFMGATGFKPKVSLEDGVNELVSYYNKLPKNRLLREKVVSVMRNA
jgi:nucleoside-diphosphate-sugar epimerase